MGSLFKGVEVLGEFSTTSLSVTVTVFELFCALEKKELQKKETIMMVLEILLSIMVIVHAII